MLTSGVYTFKDRFIPITLEKSFLFSYDAFGYIKFQREGYMSTSTEEQDKKLQEERTAARQKFLIEYNAISIQIDVIKDRIFEAKRKLDTLRLKNNEIAINIKYDTKLIAELTNLSEKFSREKVSLESEVSMLDTKLIQLAQLDSLFKDAINNTVKQLEIISTSTESAAKVNLLEVKQKEIEARKVSQKNNEDELAKTASIKQEKLDLIKKNEKKLLDLKETINAKSKELAANQLAESQNNLQMQEITLELAKDEALLHGDQTNKGQKSNQVLSLNEENISRSTEEHEKKLQEERAAARQKFLTEYNDLSQKSAEIRQGISQGQNQLNTLQLKEDKIKRDIVSGEQTILDLKKLSTEKASKALSLSKLGAACVTQKKYEEAISYFNQELTIEREIYGINHEKIAQTLHNIGATYGSQGRYDESLGYLQQALSMRKTIYGDKHNSVEESIKDIATVASLLSNTGNTFFAQKQYGDALNYYRKTLTAYRLIYDENHSNIVTTRNNIGVIATELRSIGVDHYSQKRYNDALNYFKQALVIYKIVYDDNHVDVARTLNDMGNTYHQLENPTEAFNYSQQALNIHIAIPNNGPNISMSLNSIGCFCDLQGYYDRALEYHQRALEIRTELYGDNHSTVADSLFNMGMVYLHQKRYQDALIALEHALAIRKTLFGDTHADVVVTQSQVTSAISELNKMRKKPKHYSPTASSSSSSSSSNSNNSNRPPDPMLFSSNNNPQQTRNGASQNSRKKCVIL